MNKIKEERARAFLNFLETSGFTKENKGVLDGYMRNRNIAFFHIKASFISLVEDEGWSTRKFADITYSLTKNKELYTKKKYKEYGTKYLQMNKADVLEERARYEPETRKLIKEKYEGGIKELRASEENKYSPEEQELLSYIANNGGLV